MESVKQGEKTRDCRWCGEDVKTHEDQLSNQLCPVGRGGAAAMWCGRLVDG